MKTKKEKWIYQNEWIIFYFTQSFDISFELCGYFDNRPRINLNLFFFRLAFILPFRNKWTDECDPPKWGIAIHGNIFWVYKGGKGNMNGGNKWWTWSFPFLTKKWVRTSILLKDDTWVNDTPKDQKDFYKEEWKNKQKSWTYDYTDRYDGKVIPTTIYVEEREWRPKWLTWTNLFKTVNKTIDIHFSKECGKEKGSWKGGVTGCHYSLLSGEEPLDCLKRMEKERIF
jgi:hypothetical protein